MTKTQAIYLAYIAAIGIQQAEANDSYGTFGIEQAKAAIDWLAKTFDFEKPD